MDTTLKLAIETYAELTKLSVEEVLKLLAAKDECTTRSVQMLMFSVA